MKRLTPVLLLLLMFGLVLTSLRGKSPTFDEQSYIVRGLGYLRGENRHMRVGHPLGLNALNSFMLVNDETVQLPTEHPSWQETSFHRPAELFLWEIGNDVEHVMFLARLPSMWLGLVVAALVYRWSVQLSGKHVAGLIALTLFTLDPNLLAHMRYTTTDFGLAAGAVFAGCAFWQFFRNPTWQNIVVAGLAFALLQNTKFTAGLFVPIFAIVIVIELVLAARRWSFAVSGNLLAKLAVFPIVALLALWAMYGFDIGTLPDNLPSLPQLSGQMLSNRTLPLAHHLEQLLDIGGRVQKTTPAYLLGNYSDNGWWYYFPVAFLLKTPLPTLILFAIAVFAGIWGSGIGNRGSATDSQPPSTLYPLLSTIYTLFPAGAYFLFALTTNINIGYRHLLPILPFLYIFIAIQLSRWPLAASRWLRTSHPTLYPLPSTLYLLLGWLLLTTLTTYPHFLTFFNPIAGGSDNGWQALVDSNIDWGQDLQGLGEWLHENEHAHVWLSYFGEARPDYYNIPYTGLESNPPRLMNPYARPFNPHNPAPGLYAISVTNLVGVTLDNKDTFAWFRDKEPIAKIGYSIFLYEVEANGPPVSLALGNLQLDRIPADTLASFQTNDLTPHWFDPNTSILIPANPNRHLLLGDEQELHPLLAHSQHFAFSTEREMAEADWTQEEGADFIQDNGLISLLDWNIITEPRGPIEEFTLVTYWVQKSDPQPVKIFVHLVDEENRLVTQWDGLGAIWEGWRYGDLLIQIHPMTFPSDLPAGTYTLNIGLYNPDTNVRWLHNNQDTLPLTTLETSNP